MRFQGDMTKGGKTLGAIVNLLNLLPMECVVMFTGLCPQKLRTSDSLALAGAVFYDTLHRVFDQWIASGRDEAGVETPLDRSVNTISPGYRRPLSDELNMWLTRHALPQAVDGSGQRVSREPFVDFQKLKSAPNLVGADFAVFWFLHLMDSPYRYRLAHCENPACGVWFAYDRNPRRSIKNGIFCPASACRLHGTALRRDKSREEKTAVMVDAAAEAWGKWKSSRWNTDQREWVARQVNKQCESAIQRRWVSQNMAEILKRVEVLQNGKG